MELSALTRPEGVFPEVEGSDCESVLRYMAAQLAEEKLVKRSDLLVEKLLERESICSTGVGRGIAVPHCKLPGLKSSLVAIGVHPTGISYGAPDEEPVRAFFLLISPKGSATDHLQALAEISRWVRIDGNVEQLLAARDSEAIYQLVIRNGGTP